VRVRKGRWRKLKGVAEVRLKSGRIRLAWLHWHEAHGIGRREMKRKRFWIDVMKRQKSMALKFAACIDHGDYPAPLELHKIYCMLPDEDAAADGDVRLIGESGEDYLYPAERFVPIELPRAVEKSLLQAA
jgi:hypothetical protein